MGNTVLLADKSVTIQKIVQLTFADEDFKITCVNDGQSALETIPQVHPDVILADIGLPIKNGYDLCVALRTDPAFSAFSDTPVILLAGIYETMDEERARNVELRVKEVGANALLSKPFDPQLLTAKVKELIGQGAPAPAPAAPEPDMFAEMPAPPEGGFFEAPEAPEPLAAAPPDNEKTMMLPGPPGFAANMFAEAPPFEQDVTPVPKAPVNVDAIKPEGEMVFEESELASLPEELPVPEPEAAVPGTEYSEPKDESPAFPGFDEPMIEPPAEEEAFAPAPAAAVAEEPGVAVVSGSEDPFGDVFAEPAAAPSWSAPASEEESPFGAPEPPPPPPPAPEPELAAESEAPAAVEEAFNVPDVQEETSMAMDESDREQMEEMMGAPSAPPDFGEDTWSRAQAAAEQEHPAEELFETTESGVAAAEEAVELQADTTSPGIKMEEIAAPEPERVEEPEAAGAMMMESEPVIAAARPGQAVEITDEAIERIARRVVELLSDRVVAEIVWQVVPDLAEKMIRRELEKLHASSD